MTCGDQITKRPLQSLGEPRRRGCPNNGGKGTGGWKGDKERIGDLGHGKDGFRRHQPFWQPPEWDGGWEGFRKRGGYVVIFALDSSVISPC